MGFFEQLGRDLSIDKVKDFGDSMMNVSTAKDFGDTEADKIRDTIGDQAADKQASADWNTLEDKYGGDVADLADSVLGTHFSDSDSGQLDYLEEQQALWDDLYGPTEQSLANYYNNLDPNSYAAKSVTTLQQAYQVEQEQISRSLAQRGLDTSGIQAQAITEGGYQLARDKAQARLDAPKQVAKEQASFLQLGLTEKAGLATDTLSAMNQADALDAQQQSENAALAFETVKLFSSFDYSGDSSTTPSSTDTTTRNTDTSSYFTNEYEDYPIGG